MNTDDALAQALRQAASRISVGPPPVAAVVRQGRALRRRRRAVGLAVAATVLAPVCLLAVPHGDTSPVRPGSTASASTSAQAEVVASGEKVTTPSGASLWLTGRGVFLAGAGHPASAPDTALVADTPAGHVGGVAWGTGSGTVWAGVYRGPEAPSRITLEVGSRTVRARLYTLTGSPGWVAYCAETSTPGHASVKPTIRVYAADGSLLLTTRL
ncbi:hypothetical protein ABZ865_38835 [Streptomyces sp. NPDC047085]|uniref:hypothetical protein n=1 Tax=Streptomyces sp. NPDC047085 TaxID=3155140 RepID=UPI0033F9815A